MTEMLLQHPQIVDEQMCSKTMKTLIITITLSVALWFSHAAMASQNDKDIAYVTVAISLNQATTQSTYEQLVKMFPQEDKKYLWSIAEFVHSKKQ